MVGSRAACITPTAAGVESSTNTWSFGRVSSRVSSCRSANSFAMASRRRFARLFDMFRLPTHRTNNTSQHKTAKHGIHAGEESPHRTVVRHAAAVEWGVAQHSNHVIGGHTAACVCVSVCHQNFEVGETENKRHRVPAAAETDGSDGEEWNGTRWNDRNKDTMLRRRQCDTGRKTTDMSRACCKPINQIHVLSPLFVLSCV